jgi:hypothetical protein
MAVKNKLYISPKWKTFHDFLFDYIKMVMGSDWGNIELSKPLDQMHPVLQWYQQVCEHQKKIIKTPGEIYSAPMIGVVQAYLGLAYNLYLLDHNAEIQKRLITRLKNIDQFRAACYETYVAAVFIKAGFELEFEDENDSSISHCEFTAICSSSGGKYSVEAKSREPGKKSVKVGNQLHEALKKEAKYKRVIFIDVNVPDTPAGEHKVSWHEEALQSIKEKELTLTVNGKPASEAYIFVTNHTEQFNMDSVDYKTAIMAEGFKISDFKKGAVFPTIHDAVTAREKHADMHGLINSLRTHYEIPSSFNGDLPEYANGDAKNRFQIGNRYCFGSA